MLFLKVIERNRFNASSIKYSTNQTKMTAPHSLKAK